MKQLVLLFILFLSFLLNGQETGKVPLTIDDFNLWRTINNPVISDDGNIIAWELNPLKGDGALMIWHNGVTDSISRGHKAVISPESNFIVFNIRQPEGSVRKARIAGTKKEDTPKDSLGVFVLESKSIYKYAGLESFKITEKSAKWIAFLTRSESQKDDNSKKSSISKADADSAGNLVLFNYMNADTLMFRNVTEYFYSKEGSALYFSRHSGDSAGTVSSVMVFDPAEGVSSVLFSEEGRIKSLVSDKTGEKYAFLFSGDTIDEKIYSLYSGTLAESPETIVDSYTSGIPVGWSPGEHGRIFFSDDGTRIYLGTAESPLQEPKDTLAAEEKPVVDIWNWKDLKLQPQQKVELEKEKKRTRLAVYHLDLDRFIQLDDLNVTNIQPLMKGNGDIAMGYDETPYLRAFSWTGVPARDYYLADIKSGIKREIVSGQSYVRISPGGQYVVWYDPDERSYFSRSTSVTRLDTVSLTKIIPVNFYDEDNDRPMDPEPYGIAGWSENDRFVYIYDRYDIWKLDPSGERVPVCVTRAFGRRNFIRFRYLKTDTEEEYIPSEKNSLLSGFDERNMSAGFFTFRFNTVTDPQMLIMDNYHFGNVKKSKNANKLIWTREDVSTFPDIWVSDTGFTDAQKISNANPLQDKYLWPKVQIVEWTSFSGDKLKGLLYLPENLNPDRKYPLLIYYYERNSENLYRHQHPYPSRSTINKTFYVSNGYIVFVPDIVYENGHPGLSAYNAVMSGTQHLLSLFPFIDEKRMGLQGQSWGGYQTAYIITQTDIFRAAMAGAPVSNMTSAYGGIRWQTGLSRMFQYEQQQSRIGGSLWDKPLHYIENSPLFYAPDINTPLLMMHNDDDGAVPWYQGIEMFVALRRLNKPVWLLNYNGEPHNLKETSIANRMDLSRRMFGFFNHYLKNQPVPEWMEKGVPATDKGDLLGY